MRLLASVFPMQASGYQSGVLFSSGRAILMKTKNILFYFANTTILVQAHTQEKATVGVKTQKNVSWICEIL